MVFQKSRVYTTPQNEHENCGFGFIANIKNEPKHEIVHQALEIVHNLDHRGAVGADPLAGDGAGILIQVPDEFLEKEFETSNIKLPELGQYGVGMVFLPSDEKRAQLAIDSIENIINSEMQELITWRDVPVDSNVLGETVKENAPIIKQFFVKMGSNVSSENEFLRKLYVIKESKSSHIRKMVMIGVIFILYRYPQEPSYLRVWF